MSAVLSTRDLAVTLGNKKALSGVDLDIRAGELVSIVGPNGAGKSTLLKCAMRIYRGFCGSIQVMGKDVAAYTQKDLAKAMSYVPQAAGRGLDYTVREFVSMGRYPHSSPFSSFTRQDKQAVERAMELTDLQELSHRTLPTLSGGERQRVLIAGAIAQEARILLLDEPTTFLDPKHQSDVHRVLVKLNRELEVTIVMVTHELNRAALWSDRVVALRDGVVVFEGPGDELMDEAVLRSIFDETFVLMPHPHWAGRVIVPEARQA